VNKSCFFWLCKIAVISLLALLATTWGGRGGGLKLALPYKDLTEDMKVEQESHDKLTTLRLGCVCRNVQLKLRRLKKDIIALSVKQRKVLCTFLEHSFRKTFKIVVCCFICCYIDIFCLYIQYIIAYSVLILNTCKYFC
jgi:hypothetical protein